MGKEQDFRNIQGQIYRAEVRAKTDVFGGCRHCVFPQFSHGCLRAGPCTPEFREDGRAVYWTPVDGSKPAKSARPTKPETKPETRKKEG